MGIALPQLAPASEDRASGASVIDGSLKFDSSYLKKTPGSVGNRKTFTWSGWVKLNELTSFYLFSVPDGGNGHASFMFDSGQLRWNTYNTSTNGLFTSNAYFRDIGWYHVVFAFDATAVLRTVAVTLIFAALPKIVLSVIVRVPLPVPETLPLTEIISP